METRKANRIANRIKMEEISAGSIRTEERKTSKIKEAVSWIVTILLAIAAASAINNFILFKMGVDGSCMVSTLQHGDSMFGLRIAYLFSEPERGDIITFWAPDTVDEPKPTVYVKRIIGLPGETVEIKDGVVYIDGEALKEEYKQNPMQGSYGPYEVPEGCYFMLGDNRNLSHDSIDWENTYLKREDILSKVLFRYAPDFRWFSDVNYE